MNIVNQIEIQDSSGNIKNTQGQPIGDPIKGNVDLVGSAGIVIAPDDDGFLDISAGTVTGDDPYYVQKYYDLIHGGLISGDYAFTGWNNDAIYKYISTINSSPGVDGSIFLLGGACAQLGLFSDNVHPGGVSGLTPDAMNNLDITSHGIHVFDMCAADVDCQDYSDFYDYMVIVKNALDEQKNIIENPPEDIAADGYGVFDQYIALVSYWNYLVRLLSAGSTVYQNSDDDYVIRLIYIHFGNELPEVGSYPTVTYTIEADASGLTPDSSSNTFRASTHAMEVTSVLGSPGSETLTTGGANDKLQPNTQWIVDLTLPAQLPEVAITYDATWANVDNSPTTSGSFITE